MRYVSFARPDGSHGYGRLDGDMVEDLASPGAPATLKAALAAGTLAGQSGDSRLPLASLTLLPPVPDPGKILCIGLNYGAHIAEMGRAAGGYPAVFTRWSDTLVAHGAPMVAPGESSQFDYEGELAVVIGKAGRRIAAERAMEHVAGFSILNDGSARDWQAHASQFTPGKNFPASAGFGPALVTPDEVPDLCALRVQTRLNGELMQDQPVSDMIHPVAAIIAYCSRFTTLNPGDVIATGTPSGVGHGRKPPVYLKPGDTVTVSIGMLGELINPVVAEG
ncbi:MAG: fumarylacetoacetate hydrolase family protein [Proteobacteria bacterium]|nr:fumarylacetoacetate hydrolase family protein [Pseudomonadota bacterium]